MLTTRKVLALMAALTASVGIACADDYPSHPIRLVVPYTPGGGADSVARIVAKRVSQTIGQTIVIENRGGAGSIIGTEIVQKSDPDGYTLLLGQSGPISINPAVYKNLRYDPVKDFAPITMTTVYPYILVVNATSPVKTLKEFVALVKSKPGELNDGSTGVGSANHLVTELFSSKAGLNMTHIPYRGTALAVADLLAEQVSMVFADPIRCAHSRSPARSARRSRPMCRPSLRAAIPASTRSPGTASSRRQRHRPRSSTS